jgi:hypothetical protein
MMTRKIIYGISAVFISAVLASPSAWAEYYATGKIVRTLTSQIGYGGCMVALDTLTGDCANDGNWVSLGCIGAADQVMAYRQLDQAQLAMAANKTVILGLDPGAKYGLYCSGIRIDVLN